MTEELNLGCLSRQIGAVVTDLEYNILYLGWNNASCGSESCIQRNWYDLFRKHDWYSYSDYEVDNEEFREYLKIIEQKLNIYKENLEGLPMAFCFEYIYEDIIKRCG